MSWEVNLNKRVKNDIDCPALASRDGATGCEPLRSLSAPLELDHFLEKQQRLRLADVARLG
jgi:hypothetical protein